MAGKTLTIESKVNGLKQTVSEETYTALVAAGYKGRVLKTEEPAKAAKTPEEVKDKK